MLDEEDVQPTSVRQLMGSTRRVDDGAAYARSLDGHMARHYSCPLTYVLARERCADWDAETGPSGSDGDVQSPERFTPQSRADGGTRQRLQ